MTPDQHSARRLASDLASDLARDLARDLASASDLARDLASDFQRTRSLGLTRARARALSRYLDRALTLALASASDLARDLDRHHAGVLASDLATAIHSARSRARHLASASDLHGALAGDLDSAFDRAISLMRAMAEAAELGGRALSVPPGARSHWRVKARRVTRSACRLAAVAAWLLPAGERARYGAEYRSELHDLAAAGAGRRQQLGYAVRLLVRAMPLRWAVLAPRRGKAAP